MKNWIFKNPPSLLTNNRNSVAISDESFKPERRAQRHVTYSVLMKSPKTKPLKPADNRMITNKEALLSRSRVVNSKVLFGFDTSARAGSNSPQPISESLWWSRFLPSPLPVINPYFQLDKPTFPSLAGYVIWLRDPGEYFRLYLLRSKLGDNFPLEASPG